MVVVDAQKQYQLAQTLFEEKEFSAAAHEYIRFFYLFPHHERVAEARYNTGVSFFYAGRLEDARRHLEKTAESGTEFATDAAALYLLPDASWSRRVNGVFGNRLAQAEPQRAHAVLVTKADGYAVSVRAPRSRPEGADRLCLAFATGGGRQAAAGINRLLPDDLPKFIDAFRETYK